MTRQLSTPPRTPGRGSLVRAAITALARSPTGRSIASGVGESAGKAIRKAWKASTKLAKQKKKLKKYEGKDHPVQDLGNVDSDHVILNLSTKKMTLKSRRKLYSHLVKGTIRNTYQVSALIEAVSGRQAVENYLYCGTRSHFITSGGISYNGKSTIPVGIFNMLPENLIGSNPQAASFYNGRSTTVITFDKVHVVEFSGECQMLNSTNFACEVDVYFVTPRRTQSFGCLTSWEYASEPYNNVSVGFNTALAGAAINSVTGYPSYLCYGARPNTSQSFKENFKILGVSNYLMAPGALQKMKLRILINKTFDKAKVLSEAADYMPGSIQVMFVVKGQVCAVLGAAQTGTNQDFSNNTYSSPSLRVLGEFGYTIKMYKELPARAANQNVYTSTVRDSVAALNQSNIDVTDLQQQTIAVLPPS